MRRRVLQISLKNLCIQKPLRARKSRHILHRLLRPFLEHLRVPQGRIDVCEPPEGLGPLITYLFGVNEAEEDGVCVDERFGGEFFYIIAFRHLSSCGFGLCRILAIAVVLVIEPRIKGPLGFIDDDANTLASFVAVRYRRARDVACPASTCEVEFAFKL